jgi:hypothetical protein
MIQLIALGFVVGVPVVVAVLVLAGVIKVKPGGLRVGSGGLRIRK